MSFTPCPCSVYSEVMANDRTRVFFALNPDPDTRRQLQRVSTGISDHAGRKVPAANYHLTLLFLGSVEQSILPELVQAGSRIESAPFGLIIDQAGWWREPGVLWLGPTDSPAALLALGNQLIALAESLDLLTTIPTLRPHITLLRQVRSPVELPSFSQITWQVGSFCLMESVSRRTGVSYRVLESWPLGA